MLKGKIVLIAAETLAKGDMFIAVPKNQQKKAENGQEVHMQSVVFLGMQEEKAVIKIANTTSQLLLSPKRLFKPYFRNYANGGLQEVVRAQYRIAAHYYQADKELGGETANGVLKLVENVEPKETKKEAIPFKTEEGFVQIKRVFEIMEAALLAAQVAGKLANLDRKLIETLDYVLADMKKIIIEEAEKEYKSHDKKKTAITEFLNEIKTIRDAGFKGGVTSVHDLLRKYNVNL